MRFEIAPGLKVVEILDRANCKPVMWTYLLIKVNGATLEQDQWHNFEPLENDIVSIYVRPAGGDGGKEIFRLIATIAIAVAAVVFAPAIAGAVLGTTVAAGSTAALVTTAILTTVGTLILNAVIPPPSVNLPNSNYDAGESYFINSQSNQARPYQVVPVVYGRMKMAGNLASQPEIFSAGDSSVFTTLIDWGLGPSRVTDIRAGDTQIAYFNGTIVAHENVPDYANPDVPSAGLAPVPLQLLQYPLNSQELSVGLNQDGDLGVATTVPTAYSAVVELTFPQGIAFYDKNGNLQTLGVTFEGQYRKVGDPEWLNWPNSTEGYAGDDHIWFGQGSVNPGGPNPEGNPSITIQVPTNVRSGEQFTFSLSFDKVVYQVDITDFRFIRASNTTDVTNQFTFISENEITPNRLWQFTFRAPTVADGESIQFMVATNLQNYVDAPPPNGVAFPDTAYVSPNFPVSGADITVDPDTGNPGEDDPNLYDRTPGNETYVQVNGISTFGYVPGDSSTWNILGFTVWVDGATIPSDTANFRNYAGTYQTYSQSPVFSGFAVTEWWTLKNADGSPGRSSGARFMPRYAGFPNINWPGINPEYFGARFSLYGDETKPAKASIVIQFAEQGEYEIKVQRIGDTENSDDKNQYFNAAYWSRIASRGYPFTDIEDGRRSVLNLKRKHTMSEIRLEASENVQGNLNQITGTVTSKLRGHNGSGWTDPTDSRNPAWVVADILTGHRAQQIRYPYDSQDCPGYVREDQLDLQSFRQFSQVCREKVEYEFKGETLERFRYTTDIVLAAQSPVIETVQNILAMCRAQLIMGQNGLIQIMQDIDRGSQVRQLFTPANSWGFKGERIFPNIPHGLNVEFVSPELGYQKGEVTVYRPGYDANTATIFEDLKTFGCTNWHFAAQYGMYNLGQMVLRQETFTLNVAAESLVVQRGDVCEVALDQAALGGGSHLIVDQMSANTIVISEEPNDYPNPCYTIKCDDGVFQGVVRSIVGRTIQLDRDFASPLAGRGFIVIGEQNYVTKKYIVNAIRPLPDFSAELSLVPYDERVYRTDDGDFPEWTPGGDGDPQNPNNGGNARTVDLEGYSYLEYINRQPISVSVLTWDLLTADAQLSAWKITWTAAGQSVVIDVATLTAEKREFEHKYQSNTNEFGPGIYTVTPVTQLGYNGQGSAVFVSQSIDRIPPDAPEPFVVVAEPGWTRFYWKSPDAPDVGGFTLYAKKTEGDNVEWREIGKAAVFDEYKIFPYSMDAWGESFGIVCTDTSGNDSPMAVYDGLIDGVPGPGLVEPFDWFGPEGARLEWKDLYDPYSLIVEYDLKHDPDPDSQDVIDAQFMDFVSPGTETYALPASKAEGSYWIRATDKWGQVGPWNKTGSNELDYKIEGQLTQSIFYVDRYPKSDVDISWDAVGSEANLITSYRVMLYPRQVNPYYNRVTIPKRDPITIYEGTDTSVSSTVDHFPQGDLYHQGQIVIDGLVDGVVMGSGRAIIEWELIYDTEGPPAPEDFILTINPVDQEEVTATWLPSNAPDVEDYEIRYNSRTGGDWEDSQVVGRTAWNVYEFTGPYRPGKYMIRATDTSGNVGQMAQFLLNPGGIDPNEGWELLQVIQGHPLWLGTLENLFRRENSQTIFLDPNTPVENGVQEAFFYYEETSFIPTLGETRIVSEDLVAFEEDNGESWEFMSDWPLVSDVVTLADPGGTGAEGNVDLYHEVQLPGSDVWQEFTSSEFPITGELKYRIRLINREPDADAGIRKSRILIYAQKEETP
jgi:predicted phage tail protein